MSKFLRAKVITKVSSSAEEEDEHTARFRPLDQARKEARSWRGRPRKKRKGVEDRCVHDTKNGLEQWLTVGVAHKLGPIKERRMEEAARSKTCT